ncbi:hypothetical protein U8326_05695 [Tsuneonella sp. CC-YZS046]|uniref:hypothetical protein n=1 Tax=Tsuneonella sp. CC-YZS046 TaxID=3042152 RepID=UPI002D7806E0|nr:hypothetical protein [Tsuneonella sp. CC-YZS046]WRO67647.1 hypothetical protein U8326_05695 [Tsuneonella sp. CC-YZS046]
MNYDSGRQAIWRKIEAAQARNTRRLAEQAASARDNVIRIAKEHPLRVIGGAVAVGVLAAVLLPKRNRRKLGRKTSALVTMATKFGLDYALSTQKAARKAGRASQKRISDLGETLMDSTESFRQEVDRIASEASGTARGIGGNLARQGTRVAEKMKARIWR